MDKSGCLAGRVAVVTGASSGIGRAIAVALSRQGMDLYLIGRNARALEETVATIGRVSKVTSLNVDLTDQKNLEPVLRRLESAVGKVDILVHSAGVIYQGTLERARIEDFDLQYATNARVPYLLTQRLLPLLTIARGQIVFINSSVGLTAKRPEIGQYAATKHALKAIADSLREELNPKGVRVLTLYLGRTATPMQEALFHQEGREYHPELLLQAEDVASILLSALVLPPRAEVAEIYIRPMFKTLP